MTLGELKKALTRFPADMDDMPIVIQYGHHYDILVFAGYITLDGNEQIVLGTWTAAEELIRDGKMERPDDYVSPESLGEDNETE